MIKLLIPILLISCSSFKKKSLEDELTRVPNKMYRSFAVRSREEAKTYLTNLRNVLTLLFEQSRDPYYGTLRWSEECLKMNKIGDLVETPQSIYVISELYIDSRGNAGHCEQGPVTLYSYDIKVYCNNTGLISEYKFPRKENIQIKNFELCP